jgi:CRP/FNR family transcriptional regulator
MDNDSQAVAQLASRYRCIADLPALLATRIVRESRRVAVAAGAELFAQGEPYTSFPLVLSGAVDVSMRSSTGRELRLYRVASGETRVLSTGCLLGDSRHSADAVAAEASELLLVPPVLFRELVASEPVFCQAIFAQYFERMAELLALVEAVAFQRLDRRLAARLLDSTRSLEVSHAELTRELGSVRELVSRLLGQFAERGVIRSTRARIEILDRPALEKIASAP